MKINIQFLVSLIFIIYFSSSLNAQDYPGTSAKDFCADAPWRVKSLDFKIPLITTIKDANSDDCIVDTIQIWVYDKINHKDSLIHRAIFGGLTINTNRWEYLWQVSVNELNNSPYNLSIAALDTLTFRVRLSFRDNIISEYFIQHLKVFVATTGFPSFENWYSGDTHFHSEFTNNAYEFGATIKATSKATSAMGLDWITITDHSCDFPAVGVGFQALQDSINKYNISSSCLLIRGEEVTIDNNNTNNLVDDKIHLLVYNKNLFLRGPENYFTFTNDNSGNLTTLNNALNQNVNGIAYASHPYDEMDIFLGGSLIGNLLMWSQTNYNEALTHRDDFRGLEFWNTKELYTKDVDDYSINPFPFSQNSTNKLSFYKSHLAQAESSWTQILMNDLNSFTSSKKLFGLAGSDAHGDLNYFTYSSGGVSASDNAAAKVRTLAYLPNGKSLDNVLAALKNGNTILSDGPVIVFDIDMNGDETIDAYFGEDAHIGDDKICNYSSIDSNKIKILLRWNNTDEFGGNIIKFILQYVTNNQKREFLLNGHFGINESKTGSAWISLRDLESEFNFSYKLDDYSLFKFSAYTQDSLYRSYTNPIWLKIESPIGINLKLTALIEGFYDSSTQLMSAPDTVQVELRSIISPYSKIDSAKILISTSGRGTAQFKFAETGDYYLVLKHRNSVETWSKVGGERLIKNTITSYDFTSDSAQSYGHNMVKKNAKWCIYSGDINKDEFIDGTDVSDCFNKASIGQSGYVITDVTGDNFVDGTDVSIVFNNADLGIGASHPSEKNLLIKKE
jgi:hypothetical protein